MSSSNARLSKLVALCLLCYLVVQSGMSQAVQKSTKFAYRFQKGDARAYKIQAFFHGYFPPFSSGEQLTCAYAQWRLRHPESEIVVLSTCNRVEIYAADERDNDGVSFDDITRFISHFHNVPTDEFVGSVLEQSGPDGKF